VPHNQRIVRAGAAQSLPVTGEIVAALRDAYGAQPGAMPIGGVTLNPLEVVAIDDPTGRCYRVPVTIDQASGTFNFAAPIPADGPGWSRLLASSSPAVSRGFSTRDQQRIQAAVARRAIPPERAAFYATQAAAGRDITRLDDLGAILPGAPGKLAASREDADYERMFGPRAPQGDDGGPEYGALFGTVEEAQRVADSVQAAARREVAALTDDQLFERMFGPDRSRAAAAPGAGPKSEKPARDPLAAAAAGRAGKHGRGSLAGTWNRTMRPYPPRAD
jgi:hypothetical protein